MKFFWIIAMPETSDLAYESIIPHITRLADLVHTMIVARGLRGATCEEAEVELRLRHQTCSARLTELKDKGLVRDSGRRGQTSSGRSAVIWVAGHLTGCDCSRDKWQDSIVPKRYGWIRTVCECGRFMGFRHENSK